MTRNKKILIGIIVVSLIAVGFSVWFFSPDRKANLEIAKTIKNQEVQEEQALKALKEFAGKIDQCQNFGKQALMLDFEVVDMSTTYGNFGMGTPIENLNEGMYGYTPTVEEKVAIFRDNDLWAGKINEYQVNLKADEVISMHPIDDPNAAPYYEITPDEAEKISGQEKSLYTFLVLPADPDISEIVREATEVNARRCLGTIILDFEEIDATYTFTHIVEEIGVGNSDNDVRYTSQNHILRWQNDDYTPPQGLVSEMPPFVQVFITNSGHILNYENNLSFFEDLPSNYKTPQVDLIPPDFFMPSFNEEDKIEFEGQEEQIELLE